MATRVNRGMMNAGRSRPGSVVRRPAQYTRSMPWTAESAPVIGIGCMRLSTDRNRDEDRAIAVLHAAFDAGVTVLDTADVYCRDDSEVGHNERLIARAQRAPRTRRDPRAPGSRGTPRRHTVRDRPGVADRRVRRRSADSVCTRVETARSVARARALALTVDDRARLDECCPAGRAPLRETRRDPPAPGRADGEVVLIMSSPVP